ncbi:MAG: hypothetical protein JW940_14865 [Polyangiaceae bacterium]|nr:hypothetical protein [Polyangiaceae bacterium]
MNSRHQVWLACATLAGGLGCEQPLTAPECGTLLDRYVELLLNSDRRDTTAAERLRMRDETRHKAAADPEFRDCPRKVTRAQFDCAMRALNVDDMERCLAI